jgi:hypothetical protein
MTTTSIDNISNNIEWYLHITTIQQKKKKKKIEKENSENITNMRKSNNGCEWRNANRTDGRGDTKWCDSI